MYAKASTLYTVRVRLHKFAWRRTVLFLFRHLNDTTVEHDVPQRGAENDERICESHHEYDVNNTSQWENHCFPRGFYHAQVIRMREDTVEGG